MPAYTKQMMRSARRADLNAFLRERHPDEIVVEGTSVRLRSDRSVSVKEGHSGYVDFATDETGNAVDLLTRRLGYSVADAVWALVSYERSSEADTVKVEADAEARRPSSRERREVVLPEREPGPFRRAFAYLGRRGVPAETIRSLIDRGLLYQEREHGNVVFVSEAGDFAEARGTLTYGEPFHQTLKAAPDRYWAVTTGEGEPETAYVCEGAIDAVSLMVLRERAGATEPAAYCGVGGVANESAIAAIAAKYPRVVLAVDSDGAGDAARKRHPELESLVPRGKDFNDDLRSGAVRLDAEAERRREAGPSARGGKDFGDGPRSEADARGESRGGEARKEGNVETNDLNERAADAAHGADRLAMAWRAAEDAGAALDSLDPRSGARTDRVRTGFAALDEALGGGFLPGLHVLGAVASLGKTTLAMQIAENVAATGRETVAFSLETLKRQLFAKAVSRESVAQGRIGGFEPFSVGELMNDEAMATLDPERLSGLRGSIEAVRSRSGSMAIFDRPPMGGRWTVADVEATLAWGEENGRFQRKPFVVVDYLQILAPDRGTRPASDKAAADAIVVGLQDLARRRGVAILAISSLNRANYAADADLDAFKETGSCEYAAETAMALVYAGVGKRDFDVEAARAKPVRDVELKIMKQKNGPAGIRIPLSFDAARCLFEEKPRPDAEGRDRSPKRGGRKPVVL